MNMEEAKTIGIVFDATDKEDFDLVKKYVTYLKEMKKKVKAIGFFNQKETPPMAYSKLEYDFFSLKDLSWNNIPNNIYVKNFIEDEYDILLDLNLNDLFPLRYISTLSKARFKAGKKNEKNNSIFDMMIELGKGKNLKFFLKNIDTYLFVINKKNDKQFSANEQA
jgi:GTPase SAR1 family protein